MNNKIPKTDLKKLEDLYLNTDLNLKEIGEELDITFHTIKKWLKRLDLHRDVEHTLRVQQKKYKIREDNLLRKYGVSNVSQLLDVKQKQHIHSKEMWKNRTELERQALNDKVKKTKNERYGNANFNNIQKCLATKELRYGNSHYNNQLKNNETRSKNRTSGKSKEEQMLKENLIAKYGEDNIICQYNTNSTSRLKYDFKIKNLLLELNGQFWHNYRPYRNTLKDQREYYSLKQKGGMYKAIAKHWKYDDVNKLNYCIKNNINFLVIYFDKLPQNILNIIDTYNKGQTIVTVKDKKLTVQRLSKSNI